MLEIEPHEEGPEDWVRGEVIATGFANRAMPLFRYRTGDVATLRKHAGCSCGRSRPIIEELDGRIEDYVVTPDGRRIGRMDHVFKDALLVKEAQILQSSRPTRSWCASRRARVMDWKRSSASSASSARASAARSGSASRPSTPFRARRTASSAR